MNFKLSLLIAIFSTTLIASCDQTSNPAAPFVLNDSLWTEGTGVNNVNHFYASGTNMLTCTFCKLCEQAYIFISKDNGLTWQLDTALHVYNHHDTGPITDPLWLPAPMTFIKDGSYLLAGEGDVYHGDIYRSTDNGVTWSDKSTSWPSDDSDREDIYSFCLLHGKIFAGTDDGVFVSTDQGTMWSSANIGIPKISFYHAPISAIAALGNSLFASTWAFGIYRSDNDGATWRIVNTSDYSFGGLATVGPNIFAAAFNDYGKPWTGGVFLSTDNGNTWEHVDAGLSDHGVNSICTDGTYLFVSTDSSIFASSNGGACWTEISTRLAEQAGNGGASALYAYGNYLFANSGGGIWRYPLDSIQGFTFNIKSEKSFKLKGG